MRHVGGRVSARPTRVKKLSWVRVYVGIIENRACVLRIFGEIEHPVLGIRIVIDARNWARCPARLTCDVIELIIVDLWGEGCCDLLLAEIS